MGKESIGWGSRGDASQVEAISEGKGEPIDLRPTANEGLTLASLTGHLERFGK